MKIKSERGFTVIDIATAVVILFIFVSLIAILAYNFNSSSQEIELKSRATEIAIQEIEQLKIKTIEELEEEEQTEEGTEYRKPQVVEEGFTKEIIVQDYADNNPDKIRGIVKKVTVKVQYKLKKQIETVELSIIISKES